MENLQGIATFEASKLKNNRELRKGLITSTQKKMIIYQWVGLLLALGLSIWISSLELGFVVVTLILYLLMFQFFVTYAKVESVSHHVKSNRLPHQQKFSEFTLIVKFLDDCVQMLDEFDYLTNPASELAYTDIRWLLKTSEHYVLLPKTKMGLLELFDNFIAIDKNSIDEKELITLLKVRCPKMKYHN